MHKKLIISAFQEVKAREKDKNGTMTSDTATAKLLSDFIYENQRFSFGERRLTDYYKLALDENNDEVVINRTEVVQALSAYLGYDSFKSFKDANEVDNTINEDASKDLNKEILALQKKDTWPIKEIEIFSEKEKKDRILNFKKSLPFWISVGLLVYYLGSIPGTLTINAIKHLKSENLTFIMSITPFLSLIMYCIFIFGALWSQKKE